MLDVTQTWWPAIVMAAVSGAIGGLVYELMQARLSDAGMVELFSRPKADGRSFVDLGFISSLIIGAVAAVAFLYFLTPTETTVTVRGHTVTTREYDAIKLIAASLVVGSGGSSFLSSMQSRLKAMVSETRLSTVTGQVQGLTRSARLALAQYPPVGTAVREHADLAPAQPPAPHPVQAILDDIDIVTGVGPRR